MAGAATVFIVSDIAKNIVHCLMDLAANGHNRRLGQVSSADLERGQRRGTRRHGVFDKGVYVALNCLANDILLFLLPNSCDTDKLSSRANSALIQVKV